jgi:hypothetical protein
MSLRANVSAKFLDLTNLTANTECGSGEEHQDAASLPGSSKPPMSGVRLCADA